MSERSGSMRDVMPTVARWIDELRRVFGADQVDPSIRAGMRGEPNRFYACEAGLQIGTPFHSEWRAAKCDGHYTGDAQRTEV